MGNRSRVLLASLAAQTPVTFSIPLKIFQLTLSIRTWPGISQFLSPGGFLLRELPATLLELPKVDLIRAPKANGMAVPPC